MLGTVVRASNPRTEEVIPLNNRLPQIIYLLVLQNVNLFLKFSYLKLLEWF